MKKTLALGLVILVGIVGCGNKKGGADGGEPTGSAGGAVKGSCDMKSSCVEYTKGGFAIDLQKGACEGLKFAWAENKPCAKEKAIGWCAVESSGETHYYKPKEDDDDILGHDPDSAKKDCEGELLKGKFTANASFKAEPPKVKAVCVKTKWKTCEEYTSGTAMMIGKMNCESNDGAWKEGEGKCPTESVIGTCEGKGEKIFYTAGYGFTKPTPPKVTIVKAEDDCKTHSGLKWTLSPGAADMKAPGAPAAPAAAAPKGAAPKGLPGKPAPKK